MSTQRLVSLASQLPDRRDGSGEQAIAEGKDLLACVQHQTEQERIPEPVSDARQPVATSLDLIEEPIPRAQMAAFIARTFGLELYGP